MAGRKPGDTTEDYLPSRGGNLVQTIKEQCYQALLCKAGPFDANFKFAIHVICKKLKHANFAGGE